ncbi:hypothetical protein ANN_03568 [Periplaneta americana]|uniref:Uncharacterized protein n=1 Tax=Periplaneta americana TaxID=6978 RepID=A0ABQ8TZB6_PERAM|nr:hypothetical protein ANN_03568 [Periplaneta americana]
MKLAYNGRRRDMILTEDILTVNSEAKGTLSVVFGVVLCDMYSNQELAEVHFLYDKADGNAALARQNHKFKSHSKCALNAGLWRSVNPLKVILRRFINILGYLASECDEDDNAGEMSPGSSTESYPAFAHIGLRENPGKNLNQSQSCHGMKEKFHNLERDSNLRLPDRYFKNANIHVGNFDPFNVCKSAVTKTRAAVITCDRQPMKTTKKFSFSFFTKPPLTACRDRVLERHDTAIACLQYVNETHSNVQETPRTRLNVCDYTMKFQLHTEPRPQIVSSTELLSIVRSRNMFAFSSDERAFNIESYFRTVFEVPPESISKRRKIESQKIDAKESESPSFTTIQKNRRKVTNFVRDRAYKLVFRTEPIRGFLQKFSRYKNGLSDRRRRFSFDNLREYIVFYRNAGICINDDED